MLFARSIPFFSSECCMAFLVVSGKFGPVLTCISNVRFFFLKWQPNLSCVSMRHGTKCMSDKLRSFHGH